MSAPHGGDAADTGHGSPYWRRYFEAAAHEGDDHARVGYTNARYAALMHATLRRALGSLAGRRVLDAGSGDGQVLAPFAGAARIVAMDFTGAMSARAARRGLVAVRADVTRPPFRPQSFDDVLCAEVLMCPRNSCTTNCTVIDSITVTPSSGKVRTTFNFAVKVRALAPSGTGLTVVAVKCPLCGSSGQIDFATLTTGFSAAGQVKVFNMSLDTAEDDWVS